MRNHYVPQFYLKYFLSPSPKTLWVYDKKDLSISSRTPSNTAVIGGFYSFENKNGIKDNSMEEYLSKVENDAKFVFDK